MKDSPTRRRISAAPCYSSASALIWGWIRTRKEDKRFETTEQHITVKQLLNKPTFTVHAWNPAAAKGIEERSGKIWCLSRTSSRTARKFRPSRPSSYEHRRLAALADQVDRSGRQRRHCRLPGHGRIILVVVGGMFLLPVVLILGIAKGVHWYVNRPTPTDQLYAQTQQRSVSANFPDPEKFMDAFLDRFIDAIRDDLPAYHIYLAMVHIAEALYKEENLNNPLPPSAAANAIEEGRYRDQLIAHQRKTADAPRTLEVFNATLGKAISTSSPHCRRSPRRRQRNSPSATRSKSFATFPLIDMLPDVGNAVWSLMLPFFREDVEQIGLFANLRKQLDRNFHEASGVEYPGAQPQADHAGQAQGHAARDRLRLSRQHAVRGAVLRSHPVFVHRRATLRAHARRRRLGPRQDPAACSTSSSMICSATSRRPSSSSTARARC